MLDLDSSYTQNILAQIKEFDFQLAFLALLTGHGLKHLSRWEKPLDERILKLLQELDLLTRPIHRTVKTGKIITETIFSTTPGYIDIYESRFNGNPVDKSPSIQRLEGFLFGFPPCCVSQFIKHPYAANNLDQNDQKILFHWACKNCKITQLLLPAYKNIYNLLQNSC